MKCAVCNSDEHRVIETAEKGDAIRRRRKCGRCSHKWTTVERDESAIAPFDREAAAATARELAALLSGQA